VFCYLDEIILIQGGFELEDKNIHPTSFQTSRRSFLKASAAVAGTAGVIGVSGVSGLLASTAQPSKSTDNLSLKVAGYKFDRTEEQHKFRGAVHVASQTMAFFRRDGGRTC